MKNNRIVWVLLLLVACGLFLVGLNTNNYIYNLLTVVIAFVIYRNGYSVLFGEYDKKQNAKRVQSEQMYNALYKSKEK